MLLVSLVIVVLSSFWVLIDSIQLGARKGLLGEGLLDMGPAGWFFVCLGMWIIGFPAYLIKRSDIKAASLRALEGDGK